MYTKNLYDSLVIEASLKNKIRNHSIIVDKILVSSFTDEKILKFLKTSIDNDMLFIYFDGAISPDVIYTIYNI